MNSETIRRMLLLLIFSGIVHLLPAQKITRLKTDELELIYFGKRYSYLMPHVVRTFHNALDFHEKLWNYEHKKTYILLSDFEDNGHGGAMVMPVNMILLGISPFDYAFSITPSNERFQWLLSHEFAHVTLSDKPNNRDLFWRNIMGKVARNEKMPVTAFWSYLTTPRWYAPRWYQEGIACYLETWMSGGVGRALGPYDEMYFRSIVNENYPIYSVIGLDTEGTTVDFQVGANSYLYGTRFITYLSQAYGEGKVRDLYNRTDDSKTFYASRFKQVFGKSVHQAWTEWTGFEKEFQTKNISKIREFPLTDFRPLTKDPLGSFSTVGYDTEEKKIYAAINKPGDISHVAELDLTSGKLRKVAVLDSPVLYSVAFLAYDQVKKQVFITEHNTKYRSLVRIDAATGKKTTLIELSRTGNLTYNQADRSVYGIKHDNGYASIVRIPEPYGKIIPLYTAEFGRSIIDPSVSHDGRYLSATLTGIRGEQSIILFEIAELEKGNTQFETVLKSEDNTLTQFRFSNDDQYLIGTSYYTGVSNIWRISLKDKRFEMLSNDETGLFVPQQVGEDSLFVIKFMRNGMQPGLIPIKVINDANSIEFLGNRVIDKNPEVVEYSLPPASRIKIDSISTDESAYSPLKNMSLTEAYPDIAGFRNTIALGYRLHWKDRVGLSNLNMFLGTSPWSDYPGRQKFHGQLQWDYWFWSLNASYNKTDFYDLFGPTKRSRAGYSIGLNYRKNYSVRMPFKWFYSYGVNHYGNLEVLPQFQNVETPIKNFQTISFETGASKLRKTLGGVEDEKGYSWIMNTYGYFANNKIYPSLISEQHFGFLIPFIRNTSFWIRNSVGQSLGKAGSSFSSFYFGGFRNNYVDWQEETQYRKVFAFPGVDIDELGGRNFVKTMGELNLKPIRLRNVGTTWLYPTFIKSSIFGTHLLLNPDKESTRRNLFNAGFQVDMELVLFSYMRTTWSVGYAQKYESGLNRSDQWMFSLKLLGN